MSAAEFFVPLDAVLSLGLPAAGATATFYLAGTTTKTPVYTSAALSTTHSNPVVADAAGVLPTIYLDSTISYRVLIRDILGGTIKDVDNYIPGTYLAHQGLPGVNGGTASNLTIGLFTGANGQSLAGSPEVVFTSGYSVTGKGAGVYVKDAAVDAAFVTANPRWSFRSAQGVGYRLSEQHPAWFEAFGGVGDASKLGTGGTDNLPAWLAARAFIHYFRDWPSGNYYYKPSVPIHFLARRYYFSDSLDLTDAAYVLRGAGNGAFGLAGTRFDFAAGKCGIIEQSWDTQGTQGTQTNDSTQPYNHGASSSLISDIAVWSAGGTLEAFQHGFVLKSQVSFERCFAFNFGGDGFHIAADVNTAGNANAFKLMDCGASNCGRHGLYISGGDGNAGYSIGFQAVGNRCWGILDSSFLGNDHSRFLTDGNGIAGAGPSWNAAATSTFANYGGHIWRAAFGQETLASTTQPGTNAAVWRDMGAGTSAVGLTWTTGKTWVVGGCYAANDPSARCVFSGYAETNQGDASLISGTSCFMPGFSGGSGAGLYAFKGMMFAGGGIGVRASDSAGARSYWAAWTAAPDNDGQIGTFGATATDSPGWTYHLDTSNNFKWKWNGADSTSPYNMLGASAARPFSMQFTNGHTSGAVFVTSGSAAPTTGTWARGDRILNDGSATALGTTDHWVCSVAGTPGTWLAKA